MEHPSPCGIIADYTDGIAQLAPSGQSEDQRERRMRGKQESHEPFRAPKPDGQMRDPISSQSKKLPEIYRVSKKPVDTKQSSALLPNPLDRQRSLRSVHTDRVLISS
jgi:hypothetical protein